MLSAELLGQCLVGCLVRAESPVLCMLFPQESRTGEALIEATFAPEDVPDAQLYSRLKTTASGILRAILDEGDERSQNVKRAERRGASRLYANERVEADLLCQHAQQRCVEAIKTLPKVLVAHDTGAQIPRCIGIIRKAGRRIRASGSKASSVRFFYTL